MLAARVWAILFVVVVICAVIAYVIAPKSNEDFVDEASVLAFAALVAIGIERILELVWSLLGHSRLGNWWPLKQIFDAIDTVEEQTNAVVGPALTKTTKALQTFKDGLDAGDAKLTMLNAQLDKLAAAKVIYEAEVANARKLAKGSERMTLLAAVSTNVSAVVDEAVSFGDDATATASVLVGDAKRSVDLAMIIAESFTDNPARRVASILLGAGLGMIAAGFIGLNIFAAVLGNPGDGATGDAGILAAGLGVVLTGIVLGLGSSPTHEVVKALQSYKNSRTGYVDTVQITSARGTPRPEMESRALMFSGRYGEPRQGYAVRTYRLRRTQ